MRTYKVYFHFGKDETKVLLVKGENENQVLDLIYSNKDFYDSSNQPGIGYVRINLRNVNYITLIPQKK